MQKFTDEQIEAISNWAESGATLPEIQSKITSEFGVKISYIETRFLIDDHNIELVEEKTTDDDDKANSADGDDFATNADPSNDNTSFGGNSSARVTVDQIKKPGMLLNGTVTFKNGKSTNWALDQFGSMSLEPLADGYKPTPQDLQEFQLELQNAVQGQGF